MTGGAGFIGSHLVARLLARDLEVVVLDDLSSGREANLEDAVAGAGLRGRLRFVRGSLLEDEALEAALEGVAVVFHQAAIPSVPRSFQDPARTLRANVEGTARLLRGCARRGVQGLVFASSSSVYGETPELPKHEAMVPSPLSPYALSKLAAEQLCRILAEEYGVRTVCLRYFNVFGPRQDPASQYAAVVPRFIGRMLAGKPPVIFGDGEQSRDFTYVDNVARANLLAAEALAEGRLDPTEAPAEERPVAAGATAVGVGGTGGAGVPGAGIPLNIGTGERHTVLELVATLNRILDTELEPEFEPPRPGDVRHSLAAIEAAGEALGYRPTVGFQEGLRRTVAWFRERRGPGPARRQGPERDRRGSGQGIA